MTEWKNFINLDATRITCVQAQNSTAFIECVFENYEKNRVVAISTQSSLEQFNEENGLAAQHFLTPQNEGRWLNAKLSLPDSDEPAQIAFTSGTEGRPKAIVSSYSNLNDVVNRINAAMEVTADIREYIGVPVYHSFGLGRCRAVSAAGGKAFIPQAGFDLKELQAMLTKGEINAISAVPSLWRIVLENSEFLQSVADRVRWIEIGSQYMSADEKRRLRELFYKAKIVQHYGLTEASRTTLLRVDLASSEELNSVGRPGKGTELGLTADGRLKIRGPHVTLGQLAQGTVQPLTDDQGWLETSDLAEVTQTGLFYHGRADDVINISGVKFDPAGVETEVNSGFPVEDHVVLSRIPDAMRGDGILASVLASSTRDETGIRAAIDRALMSRRINAKSAVRFQRIDSFPRTHTGKVKRKSIAEAFMATYTPAPSQSLGTPGTVEDLYRAAFSQAVKADDTFVSLGGGSLNYISVSVGLERILGTLPMDWDTMRLADLTALESHKPAERRLTATVETSVALRAYAVSAVVINHAGLGFLAGGAALLMLAAGLNFNRFQWQGSLALNFGPLARSMLTNVLLPYWALLILYPLVKGQAINFEYVFLFGNNFRGAIPPPFPAWFVAALIQGLLIFILPLLIGGVRQWAKANTFSYSLLMLGVAVIARVADGWAQWGAANGLAGMQLSWVFWLFALGFFINEARKANRHKLTASALVALLPLVFYYGDWPRVVTVAVGALLLIWMPNTVLPRFLKPTIGLIGSASLFIYLLHSRAPVEFLPPVFGIDWFRIVLGIGIGVVGYLAYSRALGLCASCWTSLFQSRVKK